MKRKRAPAAHFVASHDDSGKDQPKKKAKTAASATQAALALRCPAVSWYRCLTEWDKYGGKKPGFQVV